MLPGKHRALRPSLLWGEPVSAPQEQEGSSSPESSKDSQPSLENQDVAGRLVGWLEVPDLGCWLPLQPFSGGT